VAEVENVIRRHVSLVVLAGVLLVQVVGLAFQIKVKDKDGAPTSMLRVWVITAITPAEKAILGTANWAGRLWRDYFYLRDVRDENERLQQEIARLRLEQIRLAEDAGQAQRLQVLFRFKETYAGETVAAQVIAGSGSELSRVVYIDKGENDGIKPDMAVINPTGVVGKVIRVFPSASQVLQINDQTSGIGAILEKTRLRGILKGTPAGDTQLQYIMPDEKVEVGERVLTSGGDRIFPKGMPVGVVTEVSGGDGMFLNIRVRPSAQLSRLEEVLVITKMAESEADPIPDMPKRAADILAERLPTVEPTAPPQPQGVPGTPAGVTTATGTATPNTAGTGTTAGTAPRTNSGGSAPATGTPKPPATAAPGQVTTQNQRSSPAGTVRAPGAQLTGSAAQPTTTRPAESTPR